MNFSVFGPAHGVTGYDSFVRSFLKQWYNTGNNVAFVPFVKWSATNGPTDIDPILTEMEANNIDVDFHLNFCLLDQSHLNLQTPNFTFTMFEASAIPQQWVESAKKLDGVIVPTEFNRKTFTDSGIPSSKVIVCPVPLDIEKICNTPIQIGLKSFDGQDIMKYKHRFLNVSEYITRKNVDGLIQIWCDEVKPEDDACLVLKLNSNSGLKLDFFGEKLAKLTRNKKCAPIYLFRDGLDDYSMLSLYRNCTHYISTSYGEGWGMSESICGVLGKKVIAPNSTAFTEYLNKENSYPVMVQPTRASQDGPTQQYYHGSNWYTPIHYSVRKNLRQAMVDANNQDNTKNELLSKQLKEKCDVTIVANKLLNLVNDFKPKKMIEPSKLEKSNDYNFVMICKSLGTKCGIADYSVNLYQATDTTDNKNLYAGKMMLKGDAVDYSQIIDANNLHIANLQLEYQFISPKRLKLFINYLKNSGIIPTVTLHTVNPRAYDYHEVLAETECDIIVSSEIMANTLLDKCGINSLGEHYRHSKVKVIPMGITTSNIKSPPIPKKGPPIRIGFFGFCYFHKGIDKLIQYMQRYGEGKECLILSAKPENDRGYFDKMQNLMKQVKAPMQWESTYLDEGQITEALSTCDVIFLPYSEYGGFGVSAAIRTCLKAGVPIIGFENTFFKDDVYTSDLIEFISSNPNDFEAWSDELNGFVNTLNEDRSNIYISKRDEFVKNYNWEKIAGLYLEHFKSLIEAKSCMIK